VLELDKAINSVNGIYTSHTCTVSMTIAISYSISHILIYLVLDLKPKFQING